MSIELTSSELGVSSQFSCTCVPKHANSGSLGGIEVHESCRRILAALPCCHWLSYYPAYQCSHHAQTPSPASCYDQMRMLFRKAQLASDQVEYVREVILRG